MWNKYPLCYDLFHIPERRMGDMQMTFVPYSGKTDGLVQMMFVPYSGKTDGLYR
jgi:hypothetical protein